MKTTKILLFLFVFGIVSCSSDNDEYEFDNAVVEEVPTKMGSNGHTTESSDAISGDEESTTTIVEYTDANGDVAYIPASFHVSEKAGEQTVKTGLVVIGPDGSEFVWVPTKDTKLCMRDFQSYFSYSNFSDFTDDTDLPTYQSMAKSVAHYGGFYMGRYEASRGGGSSLSDYVPASKRVTPTQSGTIWVRFSPQDATVACENLYRDNPTVQGFFPWGCNWDTTLQWLVDSGCKTYEQVASNSTSWGNYSDDTFSKDAYGQYTGLYEEAKANNIYDMAGNNWEWTQERYGTNYVMRSGGYNLMGGPCSGSRYPAAIRDPLPGNSNHPNVCFRVALYLVVEGQSTGISNVTL